ncbi:MAG: leucine--tRNA ligase [bacterium]|nr:leucine--tRNA ligase [bacterium]
MKEYNPSKIEPKWQSAWEKDGLFGAPEDVTKENKMYILPQLPYPSGDGLHVGHAEVYTACDIYARYQRMIGKKVLQVIGWDSFGLPAENYAIKNNIHPRVSTDKAIDNFREQIKSLGISVDWDREVGAHNPDYYKWTQWFFLLMYKRGLAYRKKQSVNWCDSCKTVLANEQVVEGHCERCDTVVEQRKMEQWFLKITDYADRLVEGLDKIDWPEETKKRQKQWIGKSEGAEISFNVVNVQGVQNVKKEQAKRYNKQSDITIGTIDVFTTRPDTLFGATYLVLSPEHEEITNLKKQITNWDEVEKYINTTKKKTELDRQTQKEKTGVELKGIKAINPVNMNEIPVWIADYVLATYGTGSIMAVPAHDERDFEFARKFNLEIKMVVCPNYPEPKCPVLENAFTGAGHSVGSDFLDGLKTDESKEKMILWLEEKGVGKRRIQYKLRDWSVSRQRFWGAPIPMVFSEERKNKKYEYIFIHGYGGDSESNYFPKLKLDLEALGHKVIAFDLPNTETPNVCEQMEFLLENIKITDSTVILAHSLGGAVAMKMLEHENIKVAKVILSDCFFEPKFVDVACPAVENSCDWNFDFEKLKTLADEYVVVSDNNCPIIPREHSENLAKQLDARIVFARANGPHFMSFSEPVFLDECVVTGLMPVDFADLPVELPDDVDFKPTGQSPLTYSIDFQKGVENKYGKGWKKEVDTLDTFMCSSWYYYRYLDPKNENEFASSVMLKKWMPVDFYLGGEEHVNGHLLYSRFFTKVLFDAGYIDFDEPFLRHRHQGLILGEDNRKMSKRWGNSINPTDVVHEFGADTLRVYEMFLGPLEQTKPWSTDGVRGAKRFLDRVWNLYKKVNSSEKLGVEYEASLHKTIKKVGEDLNNLRFNTAIAKMMELTNELSKVEVIRHSDFELFLKILSPFAPHMAEELWSELEHKSFISEEEWPQYDEDKTIDAQITIVVQVNGKVRQSFEVDADITEKNIKKLVLKDEIIKKWLDGKAPKKVIYVRGRLVSIVV